MRSTLLLAGALSLGACSRTDAQAMTRVHAPGVVGDLRLIPFSSHTFGNTRQLRVLLPEGYDAPENRDRRYGVLYLADGQNLFDSTTSVFAPREWHVDETVQALVRAGKIPPMIVVGVDNAGRDARDHEYLPYPDRESETVNPAYDPNPRGKDYPAFLVDEVLPFINAHFRTLRDADHTGIGGSSYGGLISVYVAMTRPGVFGRLLAESTTFMVDTFHIIRDANQIAKWPARVAIGVGTNEGGKPACNPADSASQHDGMVDGAVRFSALLRLAGLDTSRAHLIIVPCASHTAGAWSARLPGFLEFLFGDRAKAR